MKSFWLSISAAIIPYICVLLLFGTSNIVALATAGLIAAGIQAIGAERSSRRENKKETILWMIMFILTGIPAIILSRQAW